MIGNGNQTSVMKVDSEQISSIKNPDKSVRLEINLATDFAPNSTVQFKVSL